MQITVRVNGEERALPEGCTVAELLGRLELSTEQVAVERNRRLVRRADHACTALAAGDALEVVTLVGGG